MSLLAARRVGYLLVTVVLLSPSALAAPASAIPSPEEVAELLRREPITLESWPAWRGRLTAWISDRSHATDAAYTAAQNFMKSQANSRAELPAPLSKDALAWYLLGSAYLYEPNPKGGEVNAGIQAEVALRRSIALQRNFARAHRNLAMALMLQDQGSGLRQRQAHAELDRARELDPDLPLQWPQAVMAMRQGRFGEAEHFCRGALGEDPSDVAIARGLAYAIIANETRSSPRADPIRQLLQRFPDDPALVCLHAAALGKENHWRAAYRELQHARSLGADPAKYLPPQAIKIIEEKGAPGLLETLGWVLAGFAAFYALVMVLMALAGVILASRTRGSRALELLGTQPDALVAAGQVVRTRHESGLTTLYGLALFAGLMLFYLAIPFIVAGILGGTGLLLYLIFQLNRIPVKLIVLIVVVGLGGAWAVFKSLFASPGKGSFGVPKSAEECPRLHQVLGEVAQRVDTDAVHEVYLAPGSAIGVHQEGRGPFGVFGVKRRVLTLGLSTLRFLTVDELKAILAHEYAHFSHKDTFYSRFIYQVDLSIQQALQGMAQSGGAFNYVNPFYWFLVLYYKAYSLLSAGYSRSREFLADRMASSLYGSDVFASALTKVCTEGSLFEMTIYDNIAKLLGEGQAFVNMYEAFRSYRDEQLSTTEREELYKKLLDEKGSLFASHPTFGERIEAVAVLPKATAQDPTPALSLLDNAEEVEKELTEFLTGYIHYVQQLQAQAAAAE